MAPTLTGPQQVALAVIGEGRVFKFGERYCTTGYKVVRPRSNVVANLIDLGLAFREPLNTSGEQVLLTGEGRAALREATG